MKRVGIEFIKENFKIEDGIFIFSERFDELSEDFLEGIISKNFNKSLEDFNDDDIKEFLDFLLTLDISRILYSIIGLLLIFNLDCNGLRSNVANKVLSSNRLGLYRRFLLDIINIVNNNGEEDRIEEFECFYNVKVYVEEL